MRLALALKLLWRDWRAGELSLLLASLVLAVGTVTTITLFVDRLQQALELESASFLAADRVISSSRPIDGDIFELATRHELKQAQTLSFLSMVFSEDRAQFAAVKAVSKTYPLRGELIIADAAFVRGQISHDLPQIGEVWVESRLIASLDLELGELLDVGVASFTVSKVLVKEPDRGGGFESTGPRVLMNLADVAKTQVVQPGSRLSYRYLFAGDAGQLTDFEQAVKPVLADGSRIFGVKQGLSGLGNALGRAERFLLLGGLLGVVLAGVAIALAAQRYSQRHFDHVAILKTLGATPLVIDSLFLMIFTVVGLTATLIGSGLGYVTQAGIVFVLADLIPTTLPEPGMKPIGLGLATGLICLFAFALPPLLKLRSIEPIRVMRRDFGDVNGADWLAYLAGITGVFGLMWWYSGDIKLTLTIFLAGIGSIAVLSVVAYSLLRSGRVLGMQAGSVWRLALAGMQRRGSENTMHILVFGLCIMLLLVLYLIRTDLISDWQAQIPENAPNHFAINISPEDVKGIKQLLEDNDVVSQPLYPMIRGLIADVKLMPGDRPETDKSQDENQDENQDSEQQGGQTRNLSYAALLPEDNEILSGQWWRSDYAGPALVSLEQDIAKRHKLMVGDQITFKIQGRSLEAELASIRSVSWDSMRPNFYIIFSPGALVDFPSTFMTSFYLAPSEKVFLNKLLREYPTMTVIEVDAMIAQIKAIINQVTLAIELVLGLIMISAALVLLASIQASLDERFKQQAILRTLGAGRRLIMGSLIIEFCVLGLFAGILATMGAELTVYFLEEQIFELEYELSPELWLIGPLSGALIIGVLGCFATAKVVRTPPTQILRALQ